MTDPKSQSAVQREQVERDRMIVELQAEYEARPFRMMDYAIWACSELVSARLRLREVEQERDTATTALTKIDAIRNSIVGFQKINWSEHIYPLVAALKEAGYEGTGHEIAAKNCGTLVEQLAAAESRIAQAGKLAEAARLFVETDPFSLTIQGEDSCQWCRRDRPSVDGAWSDEAWWSEDFHNSDCEGRRIATDARTALSDFDKL